MKKVKALGLISGGLDSLLAVKVLQKQANLDIYGISFFTGFYIPPKDYKGICSYKECLDLFTKKMKALGKNLGINIKVVDIAEIYIKEALLNPKFGYGSYLNPCIDCKILMLKKAKEYADKNSMDIIFTGEVSKQRPMTQYPETMRLIEKETQLLDRILRPLSAKVLPPTIYEKEGLVDRDLLLDIVGRSRKVQMKLVKEFNLDSFSWRSSGNCYLIDESYTRRLKDLFKYMKENITLKELFLLRFGRHFRISPTIKLVIARDKLEAQYLSNYSDTKIIARVKSPCKGPLALIDLIPQKDQLLTALSILARYSKCQKDCVDIVISYKDNISTYCIKPLPPLEVEKYRI